MLLRSLCRLTTCLQISVASSFLRISNCLAVATCPFRIENDTRIDCRPIAPCLVFPHKEGNRERAMTLQNLLAWPLGTSQREKGIVGYCIMKIEARSVFHKEKSCRQESFSYPKWTPSREELNFFHRL